MMICPLCGSAAHTRSSFQVSSLTKERYNQCQNINCSHTFVTHETFVRSIATPKESNPVQPHPMKFGIFSGLRRVGGGSRTFVYQMPHSFGVHIKDAKLMPLLQ